MTIDTSLVYKIRGRQSGKCIYSNDYYGQYDCIANDTPQDWKIESTGDGYYKIKSVNTGKCIYAHEHYGHWDCINDEAQKFKLEKWGNEDPREYKIYGKKSEKCLYANSDGRFGQSSCVGEYEDQRFYFVPVEYNCCMANISGKDVAKTVEYGLECKANDRDPGTTTCKNIYSKYCKEGDRILTDNGCKALENSNITLYNEIMKDKCNLDAFYKSDGCINWCRNNSTQCNKLNQEEDCKTFGIPTGECTPQKIIDVKAECKRYGLLSEQGLPIGECSPSSIAKLLKDCKEYAIEDSCSPGSVEAAIDKATQAAQLELTAKTQEQIEENYNTTQQTIAAILNITEEPITTPPPTSNLSLDNLSLDTIKVWIEENYNLFMIIIAIVVLIIFSSSSVSLLLVLKK